MSKEVSVDTNTKGGFMTRKYIKDYTKGDGGPIDSLMTNILFYLQNNFETIQFSDAHAGSIVNFYAYFPFEKLELPSVILEPTTIEMNINWVGGIGFQQEGEGRNTLRAEVDVTFDVMARTEREKYSISGTLANVLYRGLFNNVLSKAGIKHIAFKRSVSRGFDQADRVLQFHSHAIASDLIFRELVTFTFVFDWIVTDPSTIIEERFVSNVYYSSAPISGNPIEVTIYVKTKWIPITFTYT